MTIKTSLMRSAAFGVMIAIGAGAVAQAKTVEHHHKKVVTRHTVTRTVVHQESEVSQLRNELHALQARLDAQAAAQAETQGQVAAAQEQIQTAQAQDADASAAILQSIPVQVAAAVDAAKPKTDKIYYKGISITLGGFAEADSIFRSRNTANDLSTSWNSIPFAATKAGHESQQTFSGRQSRISWLAQGKPTDDITLSYYGEVDFQGAAQTANLNQSDGFNLRIRQMYGALDFANSGWHILAGQNWSLTTMNSQGITPRNEVQPMVIDSNYLPGYVYTRQPQVRVTKDFLDKTLWVAVSAEEAQTLYSGTVPANVIDSIANGSGYYGGSTGTNAAAAAGGNGTSTGTTATQSLNHIPDVVAKVAYELPAFYGRKIHVEAFGLGRVFTARVGTEEQNVYTGGVGGGALGPVIPGLLDFHASFLTGKGVSRYEVSQLPDVTFRSDGKIEAIASTSFMAGLVLHPTKMLDVYSYAGETKEERTSYAGGYGYGYNNTTSLAGCYTEGGSCSAATKFIEQVNVGFWQRLYSGPFGRAQVGAEYAYTERHAFAGANGAPIANESLFDVSFRYYPF